MPIELPHSEQTLVSIEQSSIEVTPRLGWTKGNEFTGKIRFITLTENGVPNLKKASVSFTLANDDKRQSQKKVQIRDLNKRSLLLFSTSPDEFNGARSFNLELEMNSNETLSFSWLIDSLNSTSIREL